MKFQPHENRIYLQADMILYSPFLYLRKILLHVCLWVLSQHDARGVKENTKTSALLMMVFTEEAECVLFFPYINTALQSHPTNPWFPASLGILGEIKL